MSMFYNILIINDIFIILHAVPLLVAQKIRYEKWDTEHLAADGIVHSTDLSQEPGRIVRMCGHSHMKTLSCEGHERGLFSP
ncbi:hypothetical protein FHS81_002486 [Pseudochelatococcus contaminans]|uniref:Uncharacterized protein n=1 Tax=Pseudochelatococcus contaminans TaxID=1538103 RepID=A0A7W5Z561_9HYPH|nr:hypothetical protein [Pseudochelatococcus contaminans]